LDVKKLCKKNSLVYNYNQTVSKYAAKGYRCISLAYKDLKEDTLDTEGDQELTFLGFYL
jgi:magnesium-transporting ATPase (P-type)